MSEIISDNKTVKKTGRPKGSKDITKRKTRKDNSQLCIASDDRLKILKFNRALMKFPRVADRNNYDLMSARVERYLELCEQHEILPTVAGLALAFGVDRATLWDWISESRGTIKNADVVDLLKAVYASINTQYEELLTQGKMIPVSAFFLMQNNHGYKQQTDHVITARQEEQETVSDITQRANLLD